jgi:hypothetical protein
VPPSGPAAASCDSYPPQDSVRKYRELQALVVLLALGALAIALYRHLRPRMNRRAGMLEAPAMNGNSGRTRLTNRPTTIAFPPWPA